MKNRKLGITVALALAVGLVAGTVARAEKEDAGQDGKKVTLAEVPAPVRAAIEKATAGGTIKDIEKEEEDGQTVYDVEATVNGKDLEIKIAADGKILSSKEDEDDDDEDDKHDGAEK